MKCNMPVVYCLRGLDEPNHYIMHPSRRLYIIALRVYKKLPFVGTGAFVLFRG